MTLKNLSSLIAMNFGGSITYALSVLTNAIHMAIEKDRVVINNDVLGVIFSNPTIKNLKIMQSG